MTDQAIIELLNRRDERGLAAIQTQYGGYCYTVAMNITGIREDAEECVNDTLTKLWNAIPPAKPDNLAAYAAATARNLAKNRRRANLAASRGGGETVLPLEELTVFPEAPDNVEQEADCRALGEGLTRFLGTLKEKQRKIFVQRYWFLMPVEDIASDLRIPKSTVTVTLVRLRSKLRDYLEKEGLL
ncbi:MAG: sigma-70 family RNA polymerase sigma factor [Oscillospiraceae bacterium]|nr:sigma-70 family RNA polymerase sigma factor [Oscillospiraceae bacterium]